MGIPIRGRSSSVWSGGSWSSASARFIASRMASSVSSSVPSMSMRSANIGTTSLLRGLVELPQRVTDMVDRPHGLPLLRGDHLRAREEGLTDREGSEVPLVPHPDEVADLDRRIRVGNPGGHRVRAVVNEPDGAHIDGDEAPQRGMREESADRKERPVAEEEPLDLVIHEEEPPVPCLREVDVVSSAERVHAEGGGDRIRRGRSPGPETGDPFEGSRRDPGPTQRERNGSLFLPPLRARAVESERGVET